MGRYDRIRVFDGTNWRQPRKIFVYNGSNWVDLKADDDTSQSGTLHIFDSIWKDATKHYVTHSTTVYGDYYTNGEIAIANASHYCFCPNATNNGSWQSYNKEWDFECTLKKDSDSDQLVLYIGSSGTSETHKIKVIWLADGRIKIENRFNGGGTDTVYSDNYVSANQGWVPLHIHQDKNSNTTKLWFNGQYKTGNLRRAFSQPNMIGKAGSNSVHFKDNFYLKGGGGSSAGSGTIDQAATSLTSNIARESKTVTTGTWE